MAENAPVVRADREYMNEVELQLTESLLYYAADVINALTRNGAIFGQVILSPEEAARKRAAMQGGQ